MSNAIKIYLFLKLTISMATAPLYGADQASTDQLQELLEQRRLVTNRLMQQLLAKEDEKQAILAKQLLAQDRQIQGLRMGGPHGLEVNPAQNSPNRMRNTTWDLTEDVPIWKSPWHSAKQTNLMLQASLPIVRETQELLAKRPHGLEGNLASRPAFVPSKDVAKRNSYKSIFGNNDKCFEYTGIKESDLLYIADIIQGRRDGLEHKLHRGTLLSLELTNHDYGPTELAGFLSVSGVTMSTELSKTREKIADFIKKDGKNDLLMNLQNMLTKSVENKERRKLWVTDAIKPPVKSTKRKRESGAGYRLEAKKPRIQDSDDGVLNFPSNVTASANVPMPKITRPSGMHNNVAPPGNRPAIVPSEIVANNYSGSSKFKSIFENEAECLEYTGIKESDLRAITQIIEREFGPTNHRLHLFTALCLELTKHKYSRGNLGDFFSLTEEMMRSGLEYAEKMILNFPIEGLKDRKYDVLMGDLKNKLTKSVENKKRRKLWVTDAIKPPTKSTKRKRESGEGNYRADLGFILSDEEYLKLISQDQNHGNSEGTNAPFIPQPRPGPTGDTNIISSIEPQIQELWVTDRLEENLVVQNLPNRMCGTTGNNITVGENIPMPNSFRRREMHNNVAPPWNLPAIVPSKGVAKRCGHLAEYKSIFGNKDECFEYTGIEESDLIKIAEIIQKKPINPKHKLHHATLLSLELTNHKYGPTALVGLLDVSEGTISKDLLKTKEMIKDFINTSIESLKDGKSDNSIKDLRNKLTESLKNKSRRSLWKTEDIKPSKKREYRSIFINEDEYFKCTGIEKNDLDTIAQIIQENFGYTNHKLHPSTSLCLALTNHKYSTQKLGYLLDVTNKTISNSCEYAKKMIAKFNDTQVESLKDGKNYNLKDLQNKLSESVRNKDKRPLWVTDAIKSTEKSTKSMPEIEKGDRRKPKKRKIQDSCDAVLNFPSIVRGKPAEDGRTDLPLILSDEEHLKLISQDQNYCGNGATNDPPISQPRLDRTPETYIISPGESSMCFDDNLLDEFANDYGVDLDIFCDL